MLYRYKLCRILKQHLLIHFDILCTYILVEGFLKKQKDSQIPFTTVLENPPLRQIPNYATEVNPSL